MEYAFARVGFSRNPLTRDDEHLKVYQTTSVRTHTSAACIIHAQITNIHGGGRPIRQPSRGGFDPHPGVGEMRQHYLHLGVYMQVRLKRICVQGAVY